MIRKTRLAAAFAFGAGLTVAGAAPAQTQGGSAPPPAAAAQPAPPPAQPENLSITRPDPNGAQPVYSVTPPPAGSSGIYLPAVVGGYARSVTGCVVVGCDDGPQVGGASEPPANPPPSEPR